MLSPCVELSRVSFEKFLYFTAESRKYVDSSPHAKRVLRSTVATVAPLG